MELQHGASNGLHPEPAQAGPANGFHERHANGTSESSTRNGCHGRGPAPEEEQDLVEPIAIIGLAVKFPQEASSQESFWQMLVDGRSAATEVPRNRMNIDAYYHPDKKHVGTMDIRGGHFIKEDIECFDAPFFSMSPMEAGSLDPQQRCLLEVTYQALENAGISLEKAAGSNTSVHVGSFLHEHELFITRDPERHVRYKNTGVLQSLLANRLSWFFNLTGPSITLDTACSSTLHALHLACQSLRLRECTMGIVAGSNIFYDPQSMVAMNDHGFLSPDYRCFTFDQRANGYSRGEGVATIVLKPLSLALQDGDNVRAIIRSTGLNQDGRTQGGITQPNPAAQTELIKQVYKVAGLNMARTRYFEAHGTGTPLGDFLETSALSAAFEGVRKETPPLIVGAVKTNVGHLEATSALAGLVKSILILERGVIPPNINFETLNPAIKADEWNLQFPLKALPWPEVGVRRASINSFGLGGANAHAVLDDAYYYMKTRRLRGRHSTRVDDDTPLALSNGHDARMNGDDVSGARLSKNPRLFVWSAADEHGIQRIVEAYRMHFGAMTGTEMDKKYLQNLTYTLSEKRSHLPWRSVTIASSFEELKQRIDDAPSKITKAQARRLAFVFTGQGAQWYAMGRELFAYEAFRTSVKSLDAVLARLKCEWSLEVELLKDQDISRVNEPGLSQPLCVALQVALVDLLRSWNITPSVVVGHSSGEIAAAYCAGAISLSSAIRIAYFRGIVMTKLRKSQDVACGMMAVGLPPMRAQAFLDDLSDGLDEGEISVACINSPNNVTLSGSIKKIDSIKSLLDAQGIFAKKLNVDVAYHSPYMNVGASAYRELLDTLEPGSSMPSRPAMVSSVAGATVSKIELQSAEYWVQNLISQVNFSGAVSHMCSPGFATTQGWETEECSQVDCFLELGPHAAMRSALREITKEISPGQPLHYSSLLLRNRSARGTALEAVGELHCLGLPMDIAMANDLCAADDLTQLTDLPPYPFNHTKAYWDESRLEKETRFREFPRHDLLGAPVPDWNPLDAKWRNYIRPGENPWTSGHTVNGMDVCPAAGMLVMAIEAARQVSDSRDLVKSYHFREVVFSKALSVSPDAQDPVAEIEFHLRRQENSGKLPSWSDFSLFMLDNDEWTLCCRGSIFLSYDELDAGEHGSVDEALMGLEPGSSRSSFLAVCQESLAQQELYDYLDAIGLVYGPTFRALRDIRHTDDGKITATADLKHWRQETDTNLVPHVVHPAALDAVFQLIIPALTRGCKDRVATIVPTKLDSLIISDALRSSVDTEVQILTRAEPEGFRNAKASAIAVDRATGQGYISATWHTAAVASIETTPAENFRHQRFCYHVETKPDLDLLSGAETHRWCQSDKDKYVPDQATLTKQTALCYLAMSRLTRNFGVRSDALEKPELEKYHEWATHRLAVAEAANQEAWINHTNDEKYFGSLLEEVRASDELGKLLARAAENLEGIHCGHVTATEVFFSDNDLDAMYREGLGVPHVFQQTARYIDALANKNPALRILEIGAGTGSGTERIIAALEDHPAQASNLSRFAEYCYTDISPGFLERGREKFPAYAASGLMNFSVLDIEQDPLQQNFEAESYDLIVALNVVHATSSIQNSLENARKLLKPGGHIVLIELTGADLMELEFIFGLFPGWWLSTEEHRRSGPLMSELRWDAYLKQSGFSGVDTAFRNHEQEEHHVYSAMVSTYREITPRSPPHGKITIAIDERSFAQSELATKLREQVFGSADCTVLSLSEIEVEGRTPTNYVFLWEVDGPLIHGISDTHFKLLQRVFASASSILWVYNGAEANPATSLINGIQRTYRAENEALPFALLSLLNGRVEESTTWNVMKIMNVMHNQKNAATECEYVERDGLLHINRVVETQAVNAHIGHARETHKTELRAFGQRPLRALNLGFAQTGLLNTLQFSDDLQIYDPLEPDEIEIAVKYSGVNFRDLLTALGQLNDTTLGLEGAGVVTRAGPKSGFAVGDRVCALLLGSFRTFARCKASLARHIPNSLDFETSAGLPIIFCTAYHSLVNLARLSVGESVLVHSGAGGLGQAAIQLAQLYGAEIFATVGTEEKRQLLIDQYKIKPSHIFSSRSTAFARGIKKLTGGRGVDVVINSLSGEGLRASWECIAPFGRFIETGRKDIDAFGILPMTSFADDTVFASINLVNIMRRKPDLAGQLMESILKLAAESKIFTPEPVQSYPINQIEEALRVIQSGKNSGKIVIDFCDDAKVPTLPSMIPSYSLKSDVSYLIAGGLGGLGRTVSRWMVSRGARHLILLSWARKDDADTLSFLEEMQSAGATVATPVCDICDQQSLAIALEKCAKSMPPIEGCIQAAMILKDGKFDTMPKSDFDAVLRPKIEGSWNLHTLLPRNLEFFILFSSLAGVAPSYGQANYAAGNSYQDALARYRVSRGEKAVSLDIGMVVDAGFVAQHAGLAEQLAARGAAPVNVSDILTLLEYYCDPALPVSSQSESQAIIGLQTPAALRAQGIEEPFWLQRPLFNYFSRTTSSTSAGYGSLTGGPTSASNSLEILLSAATTPEEATALVCEALATKLAKILVMDRVDIQVAKPINAHGVDSLVAMELRQWFRKMVRADVATFEILGNLSLESIAAKAAARSELFHIRINSSIEQNHEA